ncbi:MAG: hydantoinase B/oxoprolinase family protein [Betaproteobacteria bacterium]|nr:hydantoinase B/oxoprolinase family protein [Betaproteobacteria bacterium]
MNKRARSTIDPVTLATVWHGFQSLCREMRSMVTRTAQSYLMATLKDLSVGVWLADGSTVAVPEGLPGQFLGTQFAIEAIREKFKDDLHAGDVILTNDPYHGGHNSHLPDWGFIRPIFHEGELLFFTMVRGHMQDTGGSFPGGYFANAYDIIAEGLCIPPLKVIKAGVVDEDLKKLIFNNVRWPVELTIDTNAMIATGQFAENRIIDLLSRYGKDTVLGAIHEMFDRTERAVRAEIAAIPDGTYTGESSTDDDGTVLDEPVTVRVDVTVKGDEITLDFSRSDAQRSGFVNSVYAPTYARATCAVIINMDSALADFHNQGSVRPIQVIAPPGNVTNCRYPATVGACPVNCGTQVLESVIEALGKARPDRSLASWGKHRGDYTFAMDPRTGERYVRTTFDYDGSAGAVWGHDGMTGPTSLTTLGWVQRGSVEEAEIRFPWRMLNLETRPNFTGHGRWRGGIGVDWRAVNEGGDGKMSTGSSDGDFVHGKGAQGGQRVPLARTFVLHGDKKIRIKPHRVEPFNKGDTVVKLSPGGAGVGDPWLRPVEKVALDVEREKVTVEAARLIYGVVIDPASLQVDRAATAKLRAAPPAQRYEPVINEETLEIEIKPINAQEEAPR